MPKLEDEYGNFKKNPRFVRPSIGDGSYDGDYHLRNGSPCIDAGDPCYAPWVGQTDWDGQGRVMLDKVDIGVDEFAPIIKVMRKR